MRMLPLVIAFVAASPTHAWTQPVRVGVSVTEDTGGIFRSAFAGALRSLGDVEVVETTNASNIDLHIVVLCVDVACQEARSFATSVRLSSKPTATEIWLRLYQADSARVRLLVPREGLSSWVFALEPPFRDLEIVHASWVQLTGRQRIEEQVRELVARIDTQCLEKHRLNTRATRMLQQQQMTDYGELLQRIAAGPWLC